MNAISKLSIGQVNSMVLLRLLIGWHFLYEGVIKVYSTTWTAKGYLLSASFFQPFFQWLASESILPAVDVLNIFILLVVGASLLIGFPWLPQGPSEGSYWLVNKNLIEAAALLVLALFPTEKRFGIERMFKTKK
jgi:thiosulfate dehydrogenase [quinone] large subunit